LSHLAKALGVSNEDYPLFKLAFEELCREGQVVIGAGNLISLPAMSGKVVGTFRANPRGFGFVIPLEPNSHGDLFIPPSATGDAVSGDIVAARVVRKGRQPGQMHFTGEIVEILQRANNKFVGTLLKQGGGWVVQPDGKGFFDLISVGDVSAKDANHKDKVVVEVFSWPRGDRPAQGVIIKVLGRAGQYESEIESVVHQYHLPSEFSDRCINQAWHTSNEFDPDRLNNRQDITNKVIVTIDPPDAKDFDDAISLEKDYQGNWVLGVHIADVSNFVPAGSELDTEAKNRGNSVYLPGRTIPMLPEMLSNGICSLQPGQARFVKSAYLTYDHQGKVLHSGFANSVMVSTRRLTYQQVDRILKGHTKDIEPQVIELLKDMETLSRSIEKRRTKSGMIHLDLPETELIMDKSGRVVDAQPADNSYPHTIIEMFMVEANEAVAGLLDRLDVPFMRRIHPEPDSLSMKNLSQIVRAFGCTLPRTPDRAAIQNLLAAVKDSDGSVAINLIVLRSFEKAQYSPLNIGHFALASRHYCHFTSPIRRYADLLVHRLLDCHLKNSLDSADPEQVLSEQELLEIGKHITFTEERADDAEEELKTVLILQMLSNHLGEELDCVVSGLANFGVFVRSKKFGIEGLIQMADLGPDEWRYEPTSQCIVGLNSGRCVRLGWAMKVRIVSVNVPARQMNLCPVEPLVKIEDEEKKGKRGKKSGRIRLERRPRKGKRRR
jgi:ribonuclease R